MCYPLGPDSRTAATIQGKEKFSAAVESESGGASRLRYWFFIIMMQFGDFVGIGYCKGRNRSDEDIDSPGYLHPIASLD